MADEVTNAVLLDKMQGMKTALQGEMQGMKIELLQHVQGMKSDLQQQISDLGKNLSGRVGSLEKKVEEGFEEAKKHREALQEDLEETMKVQGRHTRKLARLESPK